MRGNEFNELNAFAAVAHHASFARAAEELRITPSALSQTIRELETRLQLRLLNRTTRSVSLTEAGARLLSRLKPAIAEIDAAIDELNELRGQPAGLLKIHTPRLAYTEIIEPALGDFLQAYPEVVLDVTISDAIIDIVAAGFDIGVRLGELLESDMVAVRLGHDLRQVAAASPSYIARHGKPESPRDLYRHRCINWRQHGSTGLYNWEFEKAGERLAVATRGPLTVSDRSLMLSAAVQGIGIAFWVEDRIRPLVEAGKLVTLLEDWTPEFPGFFLYYPKQRQLPTAVRAFIDLMRSRTHARSPD